MAVFGQFTLTNDGLNLELQAQTGTEIKFTKFVLGDGATPSNPSTLHNIINPIRTETIKRLRVQSTTSGKKVAIGFNIDPSQIVTGFYLREIGIFAENPNGGDDILVYYGNAGDTADYIAPASSGTISEKLIDIEITIAQAENITAIIDSSLVYATEQALENLQTYIETQLALKSNNKKVYNITLDTTWTGEEAPYTKTIQLEGMLSTYIPQMDLIYSANIETAIAEKEEYSKISKIESGSGSITLTCFEEVPETSLNVRIEVIF